MKITIYYKYCKPNHAPVRRSWSFTNVFYASGIVNELTIFLNSFEEDVVSASKQGRMHIGNWTIKINTDANILYIAEFQIHK
jgi:hypothetical protein